MAQRSDKDRDSKNDGTQSSKALIPYQEKPLVKSANNGSGSLAPAQQGALSKAGVIREPTPQIEHIQAFHRSIVSNQSKVLTIVDDDKNKRAEILRTILHGQELKSLNLSVCEKIEWTHNLNSIENVLRYLIYELRGGGLRKRIEQQYKKMLEANYKRQNPIRSRLGFGPGKEPQIEELQEFDKKYDDNEVAIIGRLMNKSREEMQKMGSSHHAGAGISAEANLAGGIKPALSAQAGSEKNKNASPNKKSTAQKGDEQKAGETGLKAKAHLDYDYNQNREASSISKTDGEIVYDLSMLQVMFMEAIHSLSVSFDDWKMLFVFDDFDDYYKQDTFIKFLGKLASHKGVAVLATMPPAALDRHGRFAQPINVFQTSRSSRLKFLVGLVLAVLLVMGGFVLYRGPKHAANRLPTPSSQPVVSAPKTPADEASKPANITLRVISDPSRAEVLSKDGQVLGHTPWSSIQTVGDGSKEVILHLPGFVDMPVRFEGTRDEDLHIKMVSKKVPAKPKLGPRKQRSSP